MSNDTFNFLSPWLISPSEYTYVNSGSILSIKFVLASVKSWHIFDTASFVLFASSNILPAAISIVIVPLHSLNNLPACLCACLNPVNVNVYWYPFSILSTFNDFVMSPFKSFSESIQTVISLSANSVFFMYSSVALNTKIILSSSGNELTDTGSIIGLIKSTYGTSYVFSSFVKSEVSIKLPSATLTLILPL